MSFFRFRFTLSLGVIFALLLGGADGVAANDQTHIGPAPVWVDDIPFDTNDFGAAADDAGNYAYVLCDLQDNLPAEQSYRHFALQVFNNNGVQEASDISVDFDPAYEELTLHYVRVHRDGQVFEKLAPGAVQTIQREDSMERHLFDGTLTAIMNLADIRRGDIIEYAYTRRGVNPIHGGRIGQQYSLRFGLAIGRCRVRVIAPHDQSIEVKLLNDAAAPTRNRTALGEEYLWDARELSPATWHSNAPAWFSPEPEVHLGSYGGWAGVVEWALPLYRIDEDELARLRSAAGRIMPAADEATRIRQAIRFVQDDVRYLGFVGGLGGYRPNPPSQVLERRYGDCKDKSQLLVGLLRAIGVTANPVLVNTDGGQIPRRSLPLPFAFDHCIASFEHAGRLHYVDPTASNEGGDVDHLAPLDYGHGLVLRAGSQGLDSVPRGEPGSLRVDVKVDLRDSTTVRLQVTSVYGGDQANSTREYFASTTQETRLDGYGAYYRKSWTSVSRPDSLFVLADDRDGTNEMTVYESYTITDFWRDDSDKPGIRTGQYLPREIMEFFTHIAPRDDAVPFAVGGPIDAVQTITLLSDEKWPWSLDDVDIVGEGYAYSSRFFEVEGRPRAVYSYRRTIDHVAPERVNVFMVDHDLMYEDAGMTITDADGDPAGGADNSPSPVTGGAGLLTYVLAGLLAVGVYHRYDPPARHPDGEPLPIGGWLKFFGLTLVGGMLFSIFGYIGDPDMYGVRTWDVIRSTAASTGSIMLPVLIVLENIMLALFGVWSILVVVLFSRRRTSTPVVFALYVVASIVWNTLDKILAYGAGNEFTGDDAVEIGRSIGYAAIWVTYLFTSARARNTFVVRRDRSIDPLPEVAAAAEPAFKAPAAWPE